MKKANIKTLMTWELGEEIVKITIVHMIYHDKTSKLVYLQLQQLRHERLQESTNISIRTERFVFLSSSCKSSYYSNELLCSNFIYYATLENRSVVTTT